MAPSTTPRPFDIRWYLDELAKVEVQYQRGLIPLTSATGRTVEDTVIDRLLSGPYSVPLGSREDLETVRALADDLLAELPTTDLSLEVQAATRDALARIVHTYQQAWGTTEGLARVTATVTNGEPQRATVLALDVLDQVPPCNDRQEQQVCERLVALGCDEAIMATCEVIIDRRTRFGRAGAGHADACWQDALAALAERSGQHAAAARHLAERLSRATEPP